MLMAMLMAIAGWTSRRQLATKWPGTRTYASDPRDEPVAWKTNVIPREEEDDLKHFFKIADIVVIRIAKKYETITFNEFLDEWIEFEKYYFRQLDLIHLRTLVCIDSHKLKDKQTRVNYAFQRYTNCPKIFFFFLHICYIYLSII